MRPTQPSRAGFVYLSTASWVLLLNTCINQDLPLNFQNAFGMLFIGFCAWLHPEKLAFVDYQLPILTANDLKTV